MSQRRASLDRWFSDGSWSKAHLSSGQYPLFESPFLARSMLMRADYGAIDHLKAVLASPTFVKRFEHHIPKARLRPSTKLAVDTVPSPEIIGQITPRCTRPCYPKHAVQDQSMALGGPPRLRSARCYKRLKEPPLLVQHQTANHRCSPQRTALNQKLTDSGIHIVHTA